MGGLTLSFLSWLKFLVFPYKRGYVKGNQRDVRGTVIIDICHNIYEDLLKMIFPCFFFTFLVPGYAEIHFRL